MKHFLNSPIRRRDLLLGGAATAATFALPTASLGAPGKSSKPANSGTPKNIILLVSDGMSTGVLDLAESLSKLVHGKGTHWLELMRDADTCMGMQETHSLNSKVTDSAAAASAWGSGCRGCNGSINKFPDGRDLTPLGKLLKESGKSLGLVTTATVTHATPAGFAANVIDRNLEPEIALQYLDLAPDVVLGGGSLFFSKDSREDRRDLFAEFSQGGYTVCEDKPALIAAPETGRKILGIFSKSHMPYTLDHRNSKTLQETVPTLAEMSAKALAVLSKNPKGFFCMMEGARIDHAAHANDAAAMLWDQLAFDDALGVALEFAKEYPDTLIVVTSDHGNANPGLNGWGEKYTGSPDLFTLLPKANASFSSIRERLMGDDESFDSVTSATLAAEIEKSLGFAPNESEAAILLEALKNKKAPNWNHQLTGFMGLLGQIAGNHNGIGWTGTTHTSDHTLLSSTGPGKAKFEGLIRNDALFEILCDLQGITFRNEPWKGSVPLPAKSSISQAMQTPHWEEHA